MTEHFLSSLRPFSPTDQSNVSLQRLAHFYLNRAHERLGLEGPESKTIITQLPSSSRISNEEVRQLYTKLKSQKKLTNFPVAAMIARNYDLPHPRTDLLNDLKAIGLCVSVWYFTTGRAFNDLQKFCYVIRNLTDEKLLWLLKLMPDHVTSVHQLINHLDGKFKEISMHQTRRFKDFFNPLKSLIDNRGANQPQNQHGMRNQHNWDCEQKTITLQAPGTDDPLSILINPPESTSPNINIEEQTFDQFSSHLFIEFNDQRQSNNKRTQIERRIKGQGLANAFIQKTCKSIFDWDNLSENEVTKLFLLEFEGAIKGNQASLLTCLSILTGRPVHKLSALPIKSHDKLENGEQWVLMNKLVCLVYVLKLPENKKKNATQVYHETEKQIWLPMPAQISELLKEQLVNDALKNISYGDHFSKLNRRFKNRLSENRTADIFNRFFEFHGYQIPLIAMLSGHSPQHCPPTFYAGIDRVDLSSAYSSFTAYLEKLTNIDELQPSLRPSSKTMIGSNVITKEHIVQARFSSLKHHLANTEEWQDFHNMYTFYTHQLLSLATGHRAVGSPFENIGDFDLEHGFIWICDKENRQEQSARFIPLSQTALRQTHFYVKHLEASQFFHSICNPDLAKEIGKSLSGEADFLFFFNGKRLTPVSPSGLTKIEKKLQLPTLKDNWVRHYLYTHLLRSRVASSCIYNFFGHAPFGLEYSSPVSLSSLAEFRDITTEIEKHFTTLAISPLNGWEGV